MEATGADAGLGNVYAPAASASPELFVDKLPTQEEFEQMAVQAAPYSCYDNGAPKAPNEMERARTAAEIAKFRVEHEPEFGALGPRRPGGAWEVHFVDWAFGLSLKLESFKFARVHISAWGFV